jgi:hypothetical protein
MRLKTNQTGWLFFIFPWRSTSCDLNQIKAGFESSPHRALLKATGLNDADMGKPFVRGFNS